MDVATYNKSGVSLSSTNVTASNLNQAINAGHIQIPVTTAVKNAIDADINDNTISIAGGIPTLITFNFQDGTNASVMIPIPIYSPNITPITYGDAQRKQFIGETFLGEYTKKSAVAHGQFAATQTTVSFPVHDAHGIRNYIQNTAKIGNGLRFGDNFFFIITSPIVNNGNDITLTGYWAGSGSDPTVGDTAYNVAFIPQELRIDIFSKKAADTSGSTPSGEGLTPEDEQNFELMKKKTSDILLHSEIAWIAAEADQVQMAFIRKESDAGRHLSNRQPPTGATGWGNDITTTETLLLVVRAKPTVVTSDYRILLDDAVLGPVSYTHLTLPTICSV